MEKFMNFAKENFYYILGGFVIFIVLIVIIVSCSTLGGNSNSYEKIEENMVEAAKEYYAENPKKLPSKEDDTISVSLAFLISNDYIKEIKDPKDNDNVCSGEIEVTKRGKSYNYQAFLDCGNNYKTEFLVDALKKSTKLDDNGNGLYKVGEEYIFKGDRVKNYVKFDDQLWRVIKIDSEGDIKIMKLDQGEDRYVWDDRYNVSTQEKNGINDFKKSRIRVSLEKYYRNNFNETEGVKEKIVKKNWCVGARKETDPINNTVECKTQISLYVGLITASEFYMASTDTSCTAFGQQQCSNYNYLADMSFNYWTLNGNAIETDKIYYIQRGRVRDTYANKEVYILPTIYLDTKVITSGGTGTESNPYIVK